MVAGLVVALFFFIVFSDGLLLEAKWAAKDQAPAAMEHRLRRNGAVAPLLPPPPRTTQPEAQPGAVGGDSLNADADASPPSSPGTGAPVPTPPAAAGAGEDLTDVWGGGVVDASALSVPATVAPAVEEEGAWLPARSKFPTRVTAEADIVPAEGWKLGSAQPRSCDAYFGNGFTAWHSIAPEEATSEADARKSAGYLHCRSHPDTTAVYCASANVVLVPDRISMSRGGEPVEAVMGRAEENEVPRFAPGAILVLQDKRLVQEGSVLGSTPLPLNAGGGVEAVYTRSGLQQALARPDPYKKAMVQQVRVLTAGESTYHCPGGVGSLVQQPVIFVTRMEYANLFHTSTGQWGRGWGG